MLNQDLTSWLLAFLIALIWTVNLEFIWCDDMVSVYPTRLSAEEVFFLGFSLCFQTQSWSLVCNRLLTVCKCDCVWVSSIFLYCLETTSLTKFLQEPFGLAWLVSERASKLSESACLVSHCWGSRRT